MQSAPAFLNWLLRKPQGVNALQNVLDARLTAQRAQNLDNLSFLTGTVAAQAKIGTPADNASSLSTLFALAQAQELLLCDIETKTRQIAASQAQEITVTVNTIIEAQYPASSGYVPPSPYTGEGFLYNVTVTSFGFGGDGYPGSAGGTSGSQLSVITGTAINPQDLNSQQYAPAIPQQTLVSSSLQNASIPGVNLPPLGGCAATVAAGVQITLAGYTPPTTVATMYPFTVGNPVPASGAYLGLKWDGTLHQFKLVARTEAGVVSEVPIPSTVALFPCTIVWSSAGITLNAADGTRYTIASGFSPAVTTGLVGVVNQSGASYLTYINLSYV
jgi:hypothetical protein